MHDRSIHVSLRMDRGPNILGVLDPGVQVSRGSNYTPTTDVIMIIIIIIYFAHVCTVYVGLTQARPNYTSDMQGLVWGEPELAYEYEFDVENMKLKYAFCSSG